MTLTVQPAAPNAATPLNQYIRLPFIGEAWVEREHDRPQGLPYFVGAVDRDDRGSELADPVAGFTVRAGRWVVTADRPGSSDQHSGQKWKGAVWLAVGGPVVALVGIVACLLAGAVRDVLASPRLP